jgi:hypothetical protein
VNGAGAYLVAARIVVIVLLALVRRIGELFGISLRFSFRHWVDMWWLGRRVGEFNATLRDAATFVIDSGSEN